MKYLFILILMIFYHSLFASVLSDSQRNELDGGGDISSSLLAVPICDDKTASKDYHLDVMKFIQEIDVSHLIDLTDYDLFIGRDLTVRANIYVDSPSPEKVWVCFNPIVSHMWMKLKPGSTQYYDPLSADHWGCAYFSKRKINHINIYPTNNIWWQTWEMEPVIEIIQRLKEKYNFSELITYGLSHGGMGAVLFSDRLAATACLALSPAGFQFEDISLKLFRKSQIALNGLVKIYDSAVLSKRCNYFIYYPAGEVIDAQIAESATRYADGESIDHLFLYKMKTVNHCFVFKLIELDLLDSIVQAVHHGNISELTGIYDAVKDLDLDAPPELDAQLVEGVSVEVSSEEPAPPNLGHISHDVEELRMLVYNLLQEKESLTYQLAAVRDK